MGPKAYTIFGPSLRKRIQNYTFKSRYKSEYLFRRKKEITRNNKFKKADNYHKHHKIQKNNIVFLLINCLTHLYNKFFPTFFGCIFFDHPFT